MRVELQLRRTVLENKDASGVSAIAFKNQESSGPDRVLANNDWIWIRFERALEKNRFCLRNLIFQRRIRWAYRELHRCTFEGSMAQNGQR